MDQDTTYRRLVRIPFHEAYELVYRYKSWLHDKTNLPQIQKSQLIEYGWTEEEFDNANNDPAISSTVWTGTGIVF